MFNYFRRRRDHKIRDIAVRTCLDLGIVFSDHKGALYLKHTSGVGCWLIYSSDITAQKLAMRDARLGNKYTVSPIKAYHCKDMKVIGEIIQQFQTTSFDDWVKNQPNFLSMSMLSENLPNVRPDAISRNITNRITNEVGYASRQVSAGFFSYHTVKGKNIKLSYQRLTDAIVPIRLMCTDGLHPVEAILMISHIAKAEGVEQILIDTDVTNQTCLWMFDWVRYGILRRLNSIKIAYRHRDIDRIYTTNAIMPATEEVQTNEETYKPNVAYINQLHHTG